MATSVHTISILFSLSYVHTISIFLSSVSSLHFNLTQFDSRDRNVQYEGDAAPSNSGAVNFNYHEDYINQVGRAIYRERLQLWDSDRKKLADFTTRFSFSIDTKAARQYGNGVAFFLAATDFQFPVNSGGGFLGLYNVTNAFSYQNQIVTVEFDTHANYPEWDPPFEHVGINNNSIKSSNYVPWNVSFHSGDTADVLIDYNATSKNLSVSWNYRSTQNDHENSSLFYQIDLSKVLPEMVIVGFSAATGQFQEQHELESWEFSSTLDVEENHDRNDENKLILGIAVPSAVLIACTVLIAFAVTRYRRRQRSETETAHHSSINDDLERGAGPRRFSYGDLALATNNFAADRKLGQGGFGAVYRGYIIKLDMAVAVKKISRGSKQGKKEYITEIKIISRLRHRNLVQLVGWCHDDGEFLLVYEFMPNGSLDTHLSRKRVGPPLTWAIRYKISLGLASALLYLHEEWEQCVIHRDIKSSNIMLDSSFNVKLGDFGLARLMDHELGLHTTGLAGTLGYMAPEYVNTGRASKESDVYSFGVVVLEIVTGRRSRDAIDESSEMGLVQWVWDLHGRGDAVGAVDGRLKMEFDGKQVECLVMVGLWCAHPDRCLRPSIRQAIQVLNFETTWPDLPAKMPVAIYCCEPSKPLVISSEEAQLSCTSMEVGR